MVVVMSRGETRSMQRRGAARSCCLGALHGRVRVLRHAPLHAPLHASRGRRAHGDKHVLAARHFQPQLGALWAFVGERRGRAVAGRRRRSAPRACPTVAAAACAVSTCTRSGLSPACMRGRCHAPLPACAPSWWRAWLPRRAARPLVTCRAPPPAAASPRAELVQACLCCRRRPNRTVLPLAFTRPFNQQSSHGAVCTTPCPLL